MVGRGGDMSRTFELVCHETRQRLWIGQGREEMTNLYVYPAARERLRSFLAATKGKPLVLLCSDTDYGDWIDYDDFGAGDDYE